MSRNRLIFFFLVRLWFSLHLCLLHEAYGTADHFLPAPTPAICVSREVQGQSPKQIRRIMSGFHTFFENFCACFNLDCSIDLIYSCIGTTVLQGQEKSFWKFL